MGCCFGIKLHALIRRHGSRLRRHRHRAHSRERDPSSASSSRYKSPTIPTTTLESCAPWKRFLSCIESSSCWSLNSFCPPSSRRPFRGRGAFGQFCIPPGSDCIGWFAATSAGRRRRPGRHSELICACTRRFLGLSFSPMVLQRVRPRSLRRISSRRPTPCIRSPERCRAPDRRACCPQSPSSRTA